MKKSTPSPDLTGKTGTDTNLDRKISRWMDGHRQEITGKVLCAGLPASVVTHLAHLVPNASVVCLTGASGKAGAGPSGNAVSETSSPGKPAPSISSGGLHEPLFIDTAPADYEGGLFDTVLFLQEIPLADHTAAPSFPRWERGTFYLRRAQLLMDWYEGEVQAVCRHLKPDGHLFSLVRAQHDEHLLGWCLALAAEGMALCPGSPRQILCRENKSQIILQGIECAAGGRTDIGRLLADHLNFLLDRMNTAAEELQGPGAEILLQADAASLLRGYHLYHENRCRGKMAVYTSAQRPDVLYYFTDVEGDEPYLRRFHRQDQDRFLRHMVGELHRQKAADRTVSWKRLSLGDDWSETEQDD